MFSSADLIDALRRRMRRSLRPQSLPGEFPPGWTAWFATMRERIGRVTGATADAITAIMLAREPSLPPGVLAALNRWQSFGTLWRQEWQPAGRDSRGLRWFSLAVTLLLHVLFAIFLIYVAYVRLMAIPTQSRAGEDVIQVQYIGEGTPEDAGGGPPQTDEVAAQPVPPRATATPTPVTPPQPSTADTPVVVEPVPPAAAPPAEQPLQVTETATPDQTFTLPPPTPVDVPQPRLPTPQVSVAPREVTVVELPAPLPTIAPRPLPTPQIAVPTLERKPAEVVVREVPAPLPQVPVRTVPAPPTPQLQARAPTVPTRDVPSPPAPPSAATPTAAPPTAATTRPSASPAPPSPSPTTRSGTQPPATAAGSGLAATPKPGALPSPKRGDDWGVSDRNRPGGQAGTPGLFNADGSPKLAGNDGKVGGGLPPGTVTEDFAKIDRNGTWLKRPPTDYTPTTFDKFWVPNESLLQEWVRRSIKEVLIPIPGTSKTIKCSVVLLALGGACDIDDPNLQDVEANARKAPEVPFKRELQEDQRSLSTPAKTP